MTPNEGIIQKLLKYYPSINESAELCHFSLQFPSFTLLKLLDMHFGIQINFNNITEPNPLLEEKLNEMGLQLSVIAEQLSEENRRMTTDEKKSLELKISSSKDEILKSTERIEQRLATVEQKLDAALLFSCKNEILNQEIRKMQEYWHLDNVRLFERAVRESSEGRYDYSSALLGELLFRIHREEETPVYMEHASAPDKERLEKIEMLALYCKGQNDFQTQNLMESFRNFQKAFEISEKTGFSEKFQAGLINNCGLLMFSIGYMNKSAKDIQNAFNSIRFAQTLDPDNALYYNNAGHILFQLHQFKQAEPFFRKAIQVDGNLPIPHNNLGSTLFHLKHYQESEKEFRTALSLDPLYPDPHQNLGNVLQVMEKYEESEREYRQALTLTPDFPFPHCHLGVLLRKVQRYDEAEKEFLEAIRLAPDYADAHFNYGNLLFELKRFDEAETQYQNTLALDPGYGKAEFMLNTIPRK